MDGGQRRIALTTQLIYATIYPMSASQEKMVEMCLWSLRKGLAVILAVPPYGKALIVPVRTSVGVEVAVGLEGKALMFVKPFHDIEVFDLVSAGFPSHIAEAVAELVKGVMAPIPSPQETPNRANETGQQATLVNKT